MRKIATILFILILSPVAWAVKIGDITRLEGERVNTLMGLGLVVGLKGTGDGGQFGPTMRPLVQALEKLADASELKELAQVTNVALVQISVVIPAHGVHSGDTLDVTVSSVAQASSLKGGKLITTPMVIPGNSGAFAYAQGNIVIEDPTSPTNAVIPGGCIMDADIVMEVIHDGHLKLILQEPSADWTTASTMADVINEAEGKEGVNIIAVAEAANSVVVTVPIDERAHPDGFISRIRRLPLKLLPTEARVELNEATGTIVITGDVEISPVVICHLGLTISTTNPPPTPTPRTPVTTDKQAVALDTTGQGGAKLQELVDALDLIRVPAADRITIIKELYKTGKLHAKLFIAGQN